MKLTTLLITVLSLASTSLALPVISLSALQARDGSAGEPNDGGYWGGIDAVIGWDNNKHIRIYSMHAEFNWYWTVPESGRIAEYAWDEGHGWRGPVDIGAPNLWTEKINALAAPDGSKITVWYVDFHDKYIKERIWTEEKGWYAGNILPGRPKSGPIDGIYTPVNS